MSVIASVMLHGVPMSRVPVPSRKKKPVIMWQCISHLGGSLGGLCSGNIDFFFANFHDRDGEDEVR
jgi:hypothetical protein